MRPEGIDLSPSRVLAIVNGEDEICHKPEELCIPDDTPLAVYRHSDGNQYALGRKCDWELWKQVGYQGMGSVDLIRELLQSAERSGIKDKSVVWYLLCDVERYEESTGGTGGTI
jgi:hypothetical protein